MKSGKLFRLPLLYIHYNIEIELDEIICQFARLHLGKMKLTLNDSETQERELKERVKIKKIPGETCPPPLWTPLKTCAFGTR